MATLAMATVQAFPRGSLCEAPSCSNATPALASSTYFHSSFVHHVRCAGFAPAAAAQRNFKAISARRSPLFSSFITSVDAFGSNASVVYGEGTCLLARNRFSKQKQQQKRSLKTFALFGLGVPELAVIAGVAVLLFGPKKLPEIGKTLGKTVKSFQQAADEFQTELKGDGESSSPGSPNSEISSAELISENENAEKRA